MNKTAIAVIGSNFGDEGKGLLTDFFVNRNSTMENVPSVVRFNGGSQAGHTVVTPNGERHVFGHIGSGSFNVVPNAGRYSASGTILTSEFIVNPLVLQKELAKLQHFTPRITCSAKCRVTTIYDMVVNSMVELSRGGNRHGSCGLGVNETVTRDKAFTPQITAYDLGDETSLQDLAEKLKKIHQEYLPRRLAELNIDIYGKDANAVQSYKGILQSTEYEHHAHQLRSAATSLNITQIDENAANPHVPLVMEGAQGLMLDEFLGEFPHVTRSMTGLPNAIVAAAELGRRSIVPVYATRAYLTRHGAGNLPYEELGTNARVEDATNIPNEWQGTLRFAPLNLRLLKQFVFADLARAEEIAHAQRITIKPGIIAVTCLDQMPAETTIVDVDGEIRQIDTSQLTMYIRHRLNFGYGMSSFGPTRQDVQF